ncbi:MAG: hypothetical protein JWO70_3280 [Betaproteobacteria bacterium]|nr:hypothetical protein [Betaproteobacteria bacterium]
MPCPVTSIVNSSCNSSRHRLKKVTVAVLAALSVGSMSHANAAAEFKLGDNAGVTAGFGVRTSYSTRQRAAPNGIDDSHDFNLDNVRLYLGGHYGNVIKGTFNTERTGGPASAGGDGVRVMDAIAQFEFMPEFNFWIGRMLPPSDRANLAGPFYALPYTYPGVVSNYPSLGVGRDNGAMVWGKPFGGKLVYSLGAYEGHNKVAALSGASDKLLYAARLHVNILDPEPAPAYYLGGTYGGSKDILSIGIAGFRQADGVGTAATPGDLKIGNIDLLFEKKFGFGVPTLEAAYYKYNLGSVDCGSGEPGSPGCPIGGDNIGGQVDGKAYLVSAALLLPQQLGWGQLQPFVRYQKFERSRSNTDNKALDFGINYVIKGPNAKVSVMYTKFEDTRMPVATRKANQFLVGAQLQY